MRRLLVSLCSLAAVAAPALSSPASAAAGDPTFAPYVTRQPGSWPAGVAVADVTGDGRPDALLTTEYAGDASNDYRLWVYPQLSDGSLSSTPSQSLPTGGTYGSSMVVATADLDEDGDLDVAVGTNDGVDIFAQDGGSLAPTWTAPPSDVRDLVLADVSGDGLADIVAATSSGIEVWWQISGDFMSSKAPGGPHVSDTRATEVEVADLTGDGRNDVVLAVGHTVHVLAQAADHSFAAPAIYDTGFSDNVAGLALGDLDSDGVTDVATTSGGNQPGSRLVTLRQTPNGVLSRLSAQSSYDIPESVEVADMTGDGRADVVVAHGGWNRVGVYAQRTDGTLGAESLYPVPYASHYRVKGLALGDVSGDGLRDVLVADYNNGLVELRSTGTATPLDTTITAGPTGSLRATTASFSFASTHNGATFQCSLDGAAWQACTSPTSYSSLSTGATHTFQVRSVAGGAVDSTPAQRSFAVEPAADLRTTLTQSAASTKKGATVTYTATVTDHGPQTATGPGVQVTLPSGLRLASATGGTCTAGFGGTVSCSFPDLVVVDGNHPSATAVVKATVTTAKGALPVTARGSTLTWDPDTTNDAASVTTTVGPK